MIFLCLKIRDCVPSLGNFSWVSIAVVDVPKTKPKPNFFHISECYGTW